MTGGWGQHVLNQWPLLPLVLFWLAAMVVAVAHIRRAPVSAVLVVLAALLFFARAVLYAVWPLLIGFASQWVDVGVVVVALATVARSLEALGFVGLLIAVAWGRFGRQSSEEA